jgi:hypothetical protein
MAVRTPPQPPPPLVPARGTANSVVTTSLDGGGTRTVVEQLTLPAVTPNGLAGSATFVNGAMTSYQAPT